MSSPASDTSQSRTIVASSGSTLGLHFGLATSSISYKIETPPLEVILSYTILESSVSLLLVISMLPDPFILAKSSVSAFESPFESTISRIRSSQHSGLDSSPASHQNQVSKVDFSIKSLATSVLKTLSIGSELVSDTVSLPHMTIDPVISPDLQVFPYVPIENNKFFFPFYELSIAKVTSEKPPSFCKELSTNSTQILSAAQLPSSLVSNLNSFKSSAAYSTTWLAS